MRQGADFGHENPTAAAGAREEMEFAAVVDFGRLPRGGFYMGRRDVDGYADQSSFAFVDPATGPAALPIRHELRNHSPDGFEWGYAGSGPAQFALAILAHATGNATFACQHYQAFKLQVIAAARRDRDFYLSRDAVLTWASAQTAPAL